MAGYEKEKAALEELGIRVVAASADPEEHARTVQGDVSFPVAYGVTREDAERIGAWWDPRGNYIQPAEFILRQDGKVVSATYSTGPIGRLDAEDVVALVRFLESRKEGKQ